MKNGNGNGLELVTAHPPGYFQEERMEDRRNLKIALLIALLMHIGLVFLVFPEIQPPFKLEPKEKESTRLIIIPKTPEPVKPWEPIELKPKIPIPDPTPDGPEDPVAVIEPPDAGRRHPDFAYTPEDIVPPDPPPVVDEDEEGLTMPRVDWSSIQRNLIYPPMGIKTRTQGYVQVEAILRRDGSIDEVKVVGGNLAFQWFREAAIAAVRKARFTPGLLYGRPVDVRMVLTVHFQLN